MFADYWEMTESLFEAECEVAEWLAYEADLAEGDPWAE